jgi:lipopolysaccharide transport system ATP-binding protein
MNGLVHRAEPVLRLQDVGVSYQRRIGLFKRGRFWALRNVSFSLYHGESLGIIGRNGAGKSTLLKILAGIINPDRGQIQRASLRAALLSLRIGFVPYLTGRENAILSAMLMGIHRRQIEQAMDEVFAFAELEEFIDQPLYTYSAGMRARLGFAVAFQSDPDILLIDEVLGVGDADFKQKSTELMRKKILSDKTVVIVSHSTSLIHNLCDRVVWIDRGESKREGATDEILALYSAQNPVTRPKKDAARKWNVI